LQQVGQSISEARQLFGKLESVGFTFNASNRDIASIYVAIEFITEISNQSSLLSLNTSIETTRAGKHGCSFSAVAAQVRQLAEKCKQATSSNMITAERIARQLSLSFLRSGLVMTVTNKR